MDGRYTEIETGAEYYVRELPNGVLAWIGEFPQTSTGQKPFTNAFLGQLTSGGYAQGDLVDLPKGQASGVYRDVQVHKERGRYRFYLPGVGFRTLESSLSRSPINNFLEWGCGFYDEQPNSASFSLTGVWKCNDGGTYYIRQHSDKVVWMGEDPNGHWSNIFFGRITGDQITGRWVDVPKGNNLGFGEITVQARGSGLLAGRIPGTMLRRTSVSGGFGGSEWHKTDSLRVFFRLQNLRIVRNADVGGINRGGDEPYLMPVYITIGGNQYRNLTQLTSPSSSARPRVISPLFQHEWGTSGDWPKNNLTWQEDLAPGTMVPVPDYIAYAETELRTFDGLQPNSSFARNTANFIPGVIAMEEASTRNDDIRAGLNALLSNGPETIHRAIVDGVGRILADPNTPLDEIVRDAQDALSDQVKNAAIASATSDLFGILGGLDRDKTVGIQFPSFSLGALREAALTRREIPVEMTFQEVGEWRVTGSISATRAPHQRLTEIAQLEVTFLTGGDDKREGSSVNLSVRLENGEIRGGIRAHRSGQRFADRSFHTARIPLVPPIHNTRGLELLLVWNREPGDGWLWRADSWELDRIRVVAFDRLNRRQILLRNKAIGVKLEGNRTLPIRLL